MLTPQEITEKSFVKAVFGGYDMTGVDDFLETIASDYTALYKENAILKSKIKVLVEKVEEYRSTEDAMRMALLTAQKMGEDIMAEANKKSAEALLRTDEEVAQKIRDMQSRIDDEQERLRAAAAETAKFVEASNELLRRHADFLSKVERIRRAPNKSVQSAAVSGTRPVSSVTPVIQQEQNPFRAPEAAPQEEHNLDETAKEIGSVVENMVNSNARDESTKKLNTQTQDTIRTRIDFENLKFGTNFKDE